MRAEQARTPEKSGPRPIYCGTITNLSYAPSRKDPQRPQDALPASDYTVLIAPNPDEPPTTNIGPGGLPRPAEGNNAPLLMIKLAWGHAGANRNRERAQAVTVWWFRTRSPRKRPRVPEGRVNMALLHPLVCRRHTPSIFRGLAISCQLSPAQNTNVDTKLATPPPRTVACGAPQLRFSLSTPQGTRPRASHRRLDRAQSCDTWPEIAVHCSLTCTAGYRRG